MIEIFRRDNKWRIHIMDETLEFKDQKKFIKEFENLVKLKEDKEPYKNDR